ncbi:hypothetical protein [Denitratimonas sp. CY0512]|uniref:hypothetical protein n=1 Tax=Denitratimonas sp. CY0512 TaxID=3131940 RepID=UPI0030B4EA95
MKLTKMFFVAWALSLCGFVGAAAPKIGVLKPEMNGVSALLSPASGQMKRQDGRPGQISLVALGEGKYRGTFSDYDDAGAQVWLDFHGSFVHASEEDVLDGKHLGSMETKLFYAPDGQHPDDRFQYGTINVIWKTPTTAIVRVQQGDQKPGRPAAYGMDFRDEPVAKMAGYHESSPLGMIDFTMRVRVENVDGSVQVVEGVAHFFGTPIANLAPFLAESTQHYIYGMYCWTWLNCQQDLMPLLLDGMGCQENDYCQVVLLWDNATRKGTLEAMVRPEGDWKTWHREKKGATGVVMSTYPGSVFPMAGVGQASGGRTISFELIPIQGAYGWFSDEAAPEDPVGTVGPAPDNSW